MHDRVKWSRPTGETTIKKNALYLQVGVEISDCRVISNWDRERDDNEKTGKMKAKYYNARFSCRMMPLIKRVTHFRDWTLVYW